MDLGLKKKVALVLGSSKGIGLAIATSLLEEGANVILNARSEDVLSKEANRLDSKYPGKVDYITADACSEASAKRIADYIENKYKKLDVFIGNIGSGKPNNTNALSIEELRRFYEINVVSNINVLGRISFLLERGINSSVVLISSVVAKEASSAPCGYAAAKSYIVTITKYLSQMYAPKGVRVNCVMPGNVYFEGGRWEELTEDNPESVNSYIESTVAMKRFGKPEEVANAVTFLSSEKASFITGALLAVDGGQLKSI